MTIKKSEIREKLNIYNLNAPLTAYKQKQVAIQFVKNEFYTHFQVSFQHISTEERNVPRPTEIELCL